MSLGRSRVGGPDLPAETPLFVQAQAGCQRSLDHLMRRHEGLVQAVVRQQYLGDLPFAEALHAGRVGLWRAILGFDPQRGLAFSTYAWPAIMRHIWQAVKDRACELAPPPTVSSPSPSPLDPATLSEAAALQHALYHLLQRLPERLQRVIVAYYGLQDDPPASYRQLGGRLGLSHERVRQLHIEALVWLRHPAHSHTLRALLQRHTLADYETANALAQRWLERRAGRHGR